MKKVKDCKCKRWGYKKKNEDKQKKKNYRHSPPTSSTVLKTPATRKEYASKSSHLCANAVRGTEPEVAAVSVQASVERGKSCNVNAGGCAAIARLDGVSKGSVHPRKKGSIPGQCTTWRSWRPHQGISHQWVENHHRQEGWSWWSWSEGEESGSPCPGHQ